MPVRPRSQALELPFPSLLDTQRPPASLPNPQKLEEIPSAKGPAFSLRHIPENEPTGESHNPAFVKKPRGPPLLLHWLLNWVLINWLNWVLNWMGRTHQHEASQADNVLYRLSPAEFAPAAPTGRPIQKNLYPMHSRRKDYRLPGVGRSQQSYV